MLFNSFSFLLVFLPVVLLGWWVFIRNSDGRLIFLILASLIFYGFFKFPEGFKLLPGVLFTTLFNFWVARQIDCRTQKRRKVFLVGALTVNAGILIYFKYLGLFAKTFNFNGAFLGQITPQDMVLPLGISFYTFNSISYVVDVYRKIIPAEHVLIRFAAFVTMFPHLLVGPIVRYGDLREQIANPEKKLSPAMLNSGIHFIVCGLFKKVILADSLAPQVSRILAHPERLVWLTGWAGIIGYSLQLYFDFSGYSDIAYGLASLLGFKFPQNFNSPYKAASVAEFWQRWNISLSNWFRDYLYIPLGGNRRSAGRVYLNLLIVFFLCGLWHGASWTFIAWGLYQGAFLIIERVGLGRLLDYLPQPLRHGYFILVMLGGWVLFRADTLSYALGYFKTMAFASGGGATGLHVDTEIIIALIAGILGSMPLIPWLRGIWEKLSKYPDGSIRLASAWWLGETLGAAALTILFVLSISSSAANTYNPFIYYRF